MLVFETCADNKPGNPSPLYPKENSIHDFSKRVSNWICRTVQGPMWMVGATLLLEHLESIIEMPEKFFHQIFIKTWLQWS